MYSIASVNKVSIPMRCERRGDGFKAMLFTDDGEMAGEIWRRVKGGWAYYIGDPNKKLFRIKLDRAEGLFVKA